MLELLDSEVAYHLGQKYPELFPPAPLLKLKRGLAQIVQRQRRQCYNYDDVSGVEIYCTGCDNCTETVIVQCTITDDGLIVQENPERIFYPFNITPIAITRGKWNQFYILLTDGSITCIELNHGLGPDSASITYKGPCADPQLFYQALKCLVMPECC